MTKNNLKIIGIIPARMASTRFPGKPFAKIHGVPMLGHVYLRSKMSKSLDEVYIATCDKEIVDYANSIGAKAIMTKNTHERASDRSAEAMLKIEKSLNQKQNIIVMIQGDEPMVLPEMIDSSVKPLIKDSSILVSNLTAAIETREEHEDPNCIKVVLDKNNFAIYFSREPIPTRKKGATDFPMWKQVCIIPFRRDFLLKFNRLKPTPLEIAESIDMERVLEHGYKVKMVPTSSQTHGVDTPEDLKLVEKLMVNDTLVSRYS